MTDTTFTPGTQPMRLMALTNNEWEIIDFYRRMSDDGKNALRRFGHAFAAGNGGFDYQRSAMERGELDPGQEDIESLKELRLLPEGERKSAIQALKNLLAKAEQEVAESAGAN